MKTYLILGAAALALSACGSSGGGGKGGSGGNSAAANVNGGGGSAVPTQDGAGSAAGAPGASEPAVSLQPGEWEIKVETANMKFEGLPGVAEETKSRAGGTHRTCMTAEDSKGPRPDMFGKNTPGNCKSEGFSWSDGRIRGKTVCEAQNGQGRTVVTMDGRYGPQTIDMTMTSQTDVMGKEMSMETRVSGRRVGECTAATKKG